MSIINGVGTRTIINGVSGDDGSTVEGDTIVFGAPRYLWPGTTAGCITADPTTIWTAGSLATLGWKVQKEIELTFPSWITTPYSWELFLEWRSQVVVFDGDGTGLCKWMIVPAGQQVGQGVLISGAYVDLTDTVVVSSALTTYSRSAAVLLSDMSSDFYLALVGETTEQALPPKSNYDELHSDVSSNTRCWLSAV
jgi:hypothetical protein